MPARRFGRVMTTTPKPSSMSPRPKSPSRELVDPVRARFPGAGAVAVPPPGAVEAGAPGAAPAVGEDDPAVPEAVRPGAAGAAVFGAGAASLGPTDAGPRVPPGPAADGGGGPASGAGGGAGGAGAG
jgi:hypothetical protein